MSRKLVNPSGYYCVAEYFSKSDVEQIVKRAIYQVLDKVNVLNNPNTVSFNIVNCIQEAGVDVLLFKTENDSVTQAEVRVRF